MRAREENASRRLYVPDSGFLFVAIERAHVRYGGQRVALALAPTVCDTAYQ